MISRALIVTIVFLALFASSCKDNEKSETTSTAKESKMKEENITYSQDSVTLHGYVVYDDNIDGKRPAVLVVPEWWGLNDYIRMRARELSKLGYLAMAVDIFGDGKTADNPTDAGKLAGPFYQNPQMAKDRIDAALAKIKTYSQADTANLAAVGYCFGGGMLLNSARLGSELKAVVSFHGSLLGTPARKDLLKTSILVCHGGADPMVPAADLNQFRKQMDSIGADYTVKVYEGATHAFTNPNATEIGKKFNIPVAYNAAADTASWNDMKAFFGKVFK